MDAEEISPRQTTHLQQDSKTMAQQIGDYSDLEEQNGGLRRKPSTKSMSSTSASCHSARLIGCDDDQDVEPLNLGTPLSEYETYFDYDSDSWSVSDDQLTDADEEQSLYSMRSLFQALKETGVLLFSSTWPVNFLTGIIRRFIATLLPHRLAQGLEQHFFNEYSAIQQQGLDHDSDTGTEMSAKATVLNQEERNYCYLDTSTFDQSHGWGRTDRAMTVPILILHRPSDEVLRGARREKAYSRPKHIIQLSRLAVEKHHTLGARALLSRRSSS